MAQEKIRCEKCARQVRYEAKNVKDHEVACEACGHSTPVEARAVARFVQTAPRKLRLVADAVRGKNLREAVTILRFTGKRAARTLLKVVESARANAESAYQMDPEQLVISRICVDGGPVAKRFMPRAQGRAATIRKRMSHISVCVRQIGGSFKKEDEARAARRKARVGKTESPAKAKAEAKPQATAKSAVKPKTVRKTKKQSEG